MRRLPVPLFAVQAQAAQVYQDHAASQRAVSALRPSEQRGTKRRRLEAQAARLWNPAYRALHPLLPERPAHRLLFPSPKHPEF